MKGNLVIILLCPLVMSLLMGCTHSTTSDKQTTTNDHEQKVSYESKKKITFPDGLDFGKENVARMVLNDKFGLMDKNGNRIVEPIYDCIYDFDGGIARFDKDSISGFINTRGEVVIVPVFHPLPAWKQYRFKEKFADGLAVIYTDAGYGYINRKGEIVIKPQYDYTYGFDNGFACVREGENYGFINTKGEYVVEPIYDFAYNFTEKGAACVRKGDKYGFINTQGEFITPLQIDDIALIENMFPWYDCTLSGVRIGDKWGFVDRAGRIVISPQFDDFGEGPGIYAFLSDFCLVLVGDKYGIINQQGDFVVPPIYDEISVNREY